MSTSTKCVHVHDIPLRKKKEDNSGFVEDAAHLVVMYLCVLRVKGFGSLQKFHKSLVWILNLGSKRTCPLELAVFWDIPWSSIFPYMCREIWKDRNNCIFKVRESSPIKVSSFRASRSARDFVSAACHSLFVNLEPMRFVHPSSYLMIHVMLPLFVLQR